MLHPYALLGSLKKAEWFEPLNLMSLDLDLQVSNFEFWIFVLIFSTAPACRKQQQMYEIQNSTCPNRWATKNIRIHF